MEALGGAASVAQFVLLSLKCVKETHEALSTFKDGPDILKLLSDDFLRVQDILERLHQSTSTSADSALDAHIQQSIQALCSRAVSLVSLQATPGDSGGKRFWKQLKTVVSESDVNRVRDELGQLVIILNLRLSGLSWNIVSEVKDDTRHIRQHIQTLDITLQSQDQLQRATLQAFEKHLLTTYKENHSNVQDELSSIEQKIESKASISMKDSATFIAQLNELKNLVISEGKATREVSASSNVNREDTTNQSPNQAVLESIERLCTLIDKKREAVDVYTEEDELAESAIEDLRSMITAVRSRKHLRLEKELDKGLRRFGRSFGQNKISINAQSNENCRIVGRVLNQDRGHKEADIGIGKVSFRFLKRKRTRFATNLKSSTTSNEGHLTDYIMSLTFLPDNRSHHMLVASVVTNEVIAGSVSSISRLQVNRVLPRQSPVFTLVKQGRVQDLLRMLQNGEASLRDHDERGASLLFYSMRQPEMCKFLIEQGLDVDHVALRWSPKGLTNCLKADHAVLDSQISKTALKPINACRRLLLTAGADPTYKVGLESFLESIATYSNDVETHSLVWQSGLIAPYASFLGWRNYLGLSPFQRACTGLNIDKKILERHVEMGAVINGRAPGGESCLHLVLEFVGSTFVCFERLLFLLQSGADPHAKDNQGRSVSDVAYNQLGLRDEIEGSYGDIWDAALHISGWNIVLFRRQNRRRKPRYDSFYTREDFEKLWKGRENECPYWDDKPWPPLEPGEEDSDLDSDFDRDDISCFAVSDYDTSEEEDGFEEDSRIQDAWPDSEDEDGGALL
ncbi:uncharacterized protein B0J16DRAFT_329304 [Fusarium flagelliforme]|uniref:uncharacterized protein n=1 Tax=Fusarium flagelliforme TaxID=2675880 RepID=UPI001E8E7FF6|nr:uncharacterized protein B0J16DRAFT_329304 [Fusarium flagelliforme]KAH7197902.1 hypothetical protein B0J16DRAFT_329304 [Fusarium flagelliforme]